MKKLLKDYDYLVHMNLIESPYDILKAKKQGEAINDGVGAIENADLQKGIDAKTLNKAKYPMQILLKLYDKSINNIGSAPLTAIMDSKGDISKLGAVNTSRATYYDIIKNVIKVHKPIVESLTEDKSKYFDFYEKYVKTLEKEKGRFTKAFGKKQDNLVMALYVSSVCFLFEMATILASETVHIWQKGAKDFDSLLEKTDDYVKIFKGAEKLWYGQEVEITKFIDKELSISESDVSEFISTIDNPQDLDEFYQTNLIESFTFNPAQSKAVGVVRIAKLLGFGLSVTMYNMFSLLRYITYLYKYKKFKIQDQMNLILKSIDMFDGKARNGIERTELSKNAVDASMTYRADMVEASNAATLDIVSKDKDKIEF